MGLTSLYKCQRPLLLACPEGPLTRNTHEATSILRLYCPGGSCQPDCKSAEVPSPQSIPQPTDTMYLREWRASLRLEIQHELASAKHPSHLLRVDTCLGQCGLHQPCGGSLGDPSPHHPCPVQVFNPTFPSLTHPAEPQCITHGNGHNAPGVGSD